MKGLVFLGDRQVELRDFPDPTPGPDEVVLEMKASGMCGSDLHFYRASTDGSGGSASLGLGSTDPVIAGHEPCGVVVARGDNVSTDVAPDGARMMNHHYAGCGSCSDCRVGWSQLCRQGITVYGVTGHGGHAEYIKVPVRTLVPLPDSLSFSAGAAISCGTGTAWGALKRLELTGSDSLAVFGQGPVGLSATILGKAFGAHVTAIDIGTERLALAKQYGADHVIDAAEQDAVEALMEMTGDQGVDKTLDCTGVADARVAAIRSARTWGTVCFVGEGNDVTINVSQDMLRKQLTIVGSWTFSALGQKECADYIAARGIAVDDLFTHQYKLTEAEQAYKLFDTQTTGKGVFLM